MQIGSKVMTPYGKIGTVVGIINSVVSVEVGGEELTYDFCDLEETDLFDSDEDTMPIPMFSIGDKVNVGDSNIIFTISGVVYDAKQRTYFYQLNDGVDTEVDIIEEEDELSIVLDDDIPSVPFESSTKTETKNDIVGIFGYSDESVSKYLACSMKQLAMLLKNKDAFYDVKTYVIKTGRSFPGTKSFTQEDISQIPSAKQMPKLKEGLRVFVYKHGKWGTSQPKNYPNSYYYPIKLDNDTTLSYTSEEEVFIPVQ